MAVLADRGGDDSAVEELRPAGNINSRDDDNIFGRRLNHLHPHHRYDKNDRYAGYVKERGGVRGSARGVICGGGGGFYDHKADDDDDNNNAACVFGSVDADVGSIAANAHASADADADADADTDADEDDDAYAAGGVSVSNAMTPSFVFGFGVTSNSPSSIAAAGRGGGGDGVVSDSRFYAGYGTCASVGDVRYLSLARDSTEVDAGASAIACTGPDVRLVSLARDSADVDALVDSLASACAYAGAEANTETNADADADADADAYAHIGIDHVDATSGTAA
jgi:hypothetical protein